jgi:hypothetical protein
MKVLNDWIKNNSSLVLTLLVGVLAFIFYNLKLIPESQISSYTLLVLVLFTLNLSINIFNISGSISKIEEKILNNTSTSILDTSEEMYEKINSLTKENITKLYVTYFSEIPQNKLIGDEVDKYRKAQIKFKVTRIVTIDSDVTLHWVEDTIEDSKNSSNPDNFHLGVLEDVKCLPFVNIVIIDNGKEGKHLILYGPHQLGIETRSVYINDSSLTNVFEKYFDDLWKSSTKLKVGKKVYEKELDKIREKVNK